MLTHLHFLTQGKSYFYNAGILLSKINDLFKMLFSNSFYNCRVFAKTKEKSVLGNFVESLKLSAKFW
jgi:hypothetical protein